jgi:hypothetical protein
MVGQFAAHFYLAFLETATSTKMALNTAITNRTLVFPFEIYLVKSNVAVTAKHNTKTIIVEILNFIFLMGLGMIDRRDTRLPL